MTQRSDAKLAGIAYLSYVAFTMTSSLLYSRATAGASVSSTLSTLNQMIKTARVTVILDLMQILCAVVLAVALYRLTAVVDGTIALLAMMFRVGEGLLGSLLLLSKLELMRLATTGAQQSADSPAYLALAGEILKRPDEGFSEFCFVVGGLLFAYLFLSGALIPRWLAWIGVVSIGIQTICVPLHIAGFIPGSVVEALWMVILLYEVPLGFWLAIKGVKPTLQMQRDELSHISPL